MAEDKISIEELLKATEEGVGELSDEELEHIAGGVITPEAASLLKSAMSMFKSGGTSLETALSNLPTLYDQLSNNPLYGKYLKQTNVEELAEFLKTNW